MLPFRELACFIECGDHSNAVNFNWSQTSELSMSRQRDCKQGKERSLRKSPFLWTYFLLSISFELNIDSNIVNKKTPLVGWLPMFNNSFRFAHFVDKTFSTETDTSIIIVKRKRLFHWSWKKNVSGLFMTANIAARESIAFRSVVHSWRKFDGLI